MWKQTRKKKTEKRRKKKKTETETRQRKRKQFGTNQTAAFRSDQKIKKRIQIIHKEAFRCKYHFMFSVFLLFFCLLLK